MVARIAHFWRKVPDDIWELSFTRYVRLRNDFIDMAKTDNQKTSVTDLSEDNLNKLASEGTNVDVNVDALLRRRRRKGGA